MAIYTKEAVQKMLKSGAMKQEQRTGLVYENKEVVIMGQGGKDPKAVSRVKRPKNWWPERKKIEAATLHVAMGNMVKVAKITKVPLETLRNWSSEDWWHVVQQRVKREQNEETDTKFSKIVDKAIDKLEKAIENGDYIYDIKRGELHNIPMSGRDLSIVAGTIFDKRQLLRGEATKITRIDDPNKHLEILAKKFVELAKGQTYDMKEVEDVEESGEQVQGSLTLREEPEQANEQEASGEEVATDRVLQTQGEVDEVGIVCSVPAEQSGNADGK